MWYSRPLHAAGRVGVVSGAASSARAGVLSTGWLFQLLMVGISQGFGVSGFQDDDEDEDDDGLHPIIFFLSWRLRYAVGNVFLDQGMWLQRSVTVLPCRHDVSARRGGYEGRKANF